MCSQVLLPRCLVNRVLTRAHDDTAHFAVDKTLKRVREEYYWGTMFKDVSWWCRSCAICQGRNRPAVSPKAPLQFTPIPVAPWQAIALDFVRPLVTTPRGNTVILVITDKLSKFVVNIPLPNQLASTTAEALVNQVFCVHSFPVSIHTDQGRNFESGLFQSLCEMSGIDKTRTSAYHPQANGTTKRYNGTMATMLSKYTDPFTQSDWDLQLPLVAFAYNTSVHSVTGIQPFDLHFGRVPRARLQMFASTPIVAKSKKAREWLTEMQTRVKRLSQQAQVAAKQAQVKQREQYGEDRAYSPFKKGHLVMLREYACKKGLRPKLVREKWTGPWKVQSVRGPVNYRIVMGKNRRLVHHNRLKLYHQRTQVLTEAGPQTLGEEPEIEAGEEDLGDQMMIWEETQEPPLEVPPAPVPPAPQVPHPQADPLMGHDGRRWCAVDPANIMVGRRGVRN